MAESDAADSSKNVIKVEEEIEGDQIGTRNYRFSKIGESVPIKSDADFRFDMESLPARPMAVSERFGMIFVAHSSGFCVARTKDVMNTAEELKNGGSGSCIQELSVVDVSLGKVSILALSADSSMLAASVGSDLHFFSVEGLLNKDQEPSFSKSLDGSSSIKDMQWSPRLKDQYVVLMNDGNLYHAAVQNDLNNLMDNVDAVNWSMDGKYLAVAKHDYLSILSSKLEEKLRIKLLFDSLVDNSDAESVVKVDSIRWVRPDCIILGCYCLTADGKEENYQLQIISVKDGKITNSSSSPVALTFSDAFLSINEDDIPSGSGPHMFVSYLDECEIGFVANRKNTDQHIVLFGLSSEKNNGAEMIEITNDAWLPTINLQDNSDDNLILGLAVDKVYKDEKLRLTLGEEDTEVSPSCILMCLTIDAKLFMFHFASATGPSILSEDSSSVSDEEDESTPISSHIINNQKQIEDQNHEELHPQKVKVEEPSEKASHEVHTTKEDEKTKPTSISQPLFKPSEPFFKNQEIGGGKTSSDSVSKPANDKSNKTLFGGLQDFKVSTESSVKKPLFSGFLGSSGSFSSGPLFSSNDFGGQSSSSYSSSSFSGVQGITESSVNKTSIGLLGSSGSFSSGSLFSSNVFGGQSSSSSSSSSFSSGVQRSTESSLVSKTSTDLHGSSGSFSSGSLFSSNIFGSQSSSSSSSSLTLTSKIGSTNPPVSSTTFNKSVQANTGTTPFSSTPLKLSFPKMPSAPPTSTNSTTINTLPLISTAPPSLGKSLDLKSSDKGNYKSQTQSRLLNSDPNLPEQRTVEEMAKELDTLLESIQAPGGFYDASVAAHKPSVTSLEQGISLLSEKCQKWTDNMDQGTEEVQLLLDKTVQVLARKIYMEAIVKQATDTQYLDIWNRQKLNSELEMKRRHILEINQNLTNQLIELELHLNTLELQRFGDKGDIETNRRSFHTRHGPPRHVQSLHSLHNTMNAQLAAAEKLSECLSKQMAVLSIETGPTKKQNVKKELFDAIGISYDTTAFNSPSQEKTKSVPPKSQLVISSSSNTKKSKQGAVKSSEPETARRRRDSLDRSWASIEPPKTTVKRMLLKEERQMTPARFSLPPGTRKPDHRFSVGPDPSPAVSRDITPGTLNTSQSRNTDVQVKRNSERISNPSLWGNHGSDSSKTPVIVSQSTPIVSQEAEKSKSRFTFTLKSDPVPVNVPKISQQSPSFLEPSSNTARPPTTATNIFQKKPIEFPESSNKETEKPKFPLGDVIQKPKLPESTSIWSKKSQESPFSAMSSATSSSTAFSGKSFSLESSSTKDKQPSESVSSSVPSLPVPVTSPPSTFAFKDTTTQTKPSTTFGTKSDATHPTSLPVPSPSFPSFSPSVKPSVTTDLNTSKSEPSRLNPDTSETSTPTLNLLSLPKFDVKPDQNPSTQVSLPTPVVSSVATNAPSLPSTSKPEDVTVTQEDEMEEEAPVPDTSLTLGNLGGFGLGSAPNPGAPKQNPFGAPFGNPVATAPVPSFTPPQPTGGLFRPASFNIQSSPPTQPPQPSQQGSFGAFSGGFGGGGGGQGFGQPAQIGSGQQALGSVLGSFGQSRQLGGPSSFGGGFGGSQTAGGFATAAATGGGFASLASGGGGFGGLATGGGGFAAAATGGGGFAAAAATGSGGFGGAAAGGGGFGGTAGGGGGFGGVAAGGGGFGGAAAGSGGGFGGVAAGGGGGFGGAAAGGGGFGGFGSQSGSGFSTFGSSGGTARPPSSELFTQMRR
ncbi:hypothetical protein L2E82_28952 [Cichorium intybus]|uniref:Uncharacterized protein n=1 Tax=Cichorium intybus TaxID=13427 RepID=A0ACB9CX87_CICIN|nr:hypothetical protein L2E82_28952 [Cichorium intybus]